MALKLWNVFKFFGPAVMPIVVLVDVSLEIVQGESVAIVGASGCGKTTLLNIAGGLLQPDTGKVLWDEQLVGKLKRGSFLGFIFQSCALVNELTVLENVLLPLRILGLKLDKARAKELLAVVRLEHRMHAMPSTLSGGERQRAAIVRALISSPQFVIADEPTGNLDERTSLEVEELMFGLCREMKVGLIFATHDQRIAQRASRTFSLTAGRLHEVKKPLEPTTFFA
ncbi:MAG: ABC transporter ATP-binding protein [Puniceicoccales bacterium]|jgi:ABC-type lipoprotein export system ATPase subunit|nr:ABC transporter ATP-binding protein [Puniceicoccales bacterium]